MAGTLDVALKYAGDERQRFLAELEEFLRIRSISSDPKCQDNMAHAADWVAERLDRMGASMVKVQKTDRHPIVYGEITPDGKLEKANKGPSILIYGHYDVQCPDPVDEWQTDPFDPVVKGDELFSRGAVDNKGPIVAAIAAVESLLRTGPIPATVKFMIEGEEEIGSPSLPHFMASNKELLSADFSLNGDAGMAAADRPTITYTLRGTAQAALTIKGAKVDLHSGLFGGLVQNPIHVIADLIGRMHDVNGRVSLPGFYDDVRSLDMEERAMLAQIPRGEAFTKALTGVPALWGEKEFSPVERTGARPALDVLLIHVGAQKSAIPSVARATISMRLVPDQKPVIAFEQLRAFIESNVPPTASWDLEYQGGSDPARVDRDSLWVKAMGRALETTWGEGPLYDRVGGSIPAVAMMSDILGIDSVLIGVYRPGDNLHAPNEKMHLPTWNRTIETIIRFIYNLAE